MTSTLPWYQNQTKTNQKKKKKEEEKKITPDISDQCRCKNPQQILAN